MIGTQILQGQGLGNKFLAHIREVDAITHVVRCFENDDVIHVANKIDPLADIDTIDTELALADLESVDKAISRYDFSAEPAKEGDAIAARLVTLALQDAVTRGTGRSLLSAGLGPLRVAGKTGTSNDSRDSWFAGYTGDHLAVVWVGNDQNQPTGLYGATGGMRVWSDTFARMPSAPLRLSGDGLDWQWVADGYSTDAGCPGARRFAFVAGYAPPYRQCVYAPPPALDEFGNPIAPPVEGERALERAGQAIRDWFGGGDPAKQAPPEPAPEPAR